MADTIDDGGPAFPVECVYDQDGNILQGSQTGPHTGWHEGISARDYFAAAALQGMMAYGMTEKLDPDELAHDAYCTADAMLSARKKGGE